MARNLEDYLPPVKEDGIVTAKNATIGGNLAVTGTANITGATTFTVAPVGPDTRTAVTQSALVGATVVLTAADSGGVFVNRSTSGSPSWTMPTNVAGLYYTFVCANTTAGFTLTGGTFKALTNPGGTGTAITGTTLTHTQATADIGDSITFVADGTNWLATSQAGIFTAA